MEAWEPFKSVFRFVYDDRTSRVVDDMPETFFVVEKDPVVVILYIEFSLIGLKNITGRIIDSDFSVDSIVKVWQLGFDRTGTRSRRIEVPEKHNQGNDADQKTNRPWNEPCF